MVRTMTVALLAVMCAATPALAADRADAKDDRTETVLPTLPLAPTVSSGETTARPAILPTLYASLAALQIYDGYSTLQGRQRGLAEGNPMMQGMANNPAAFWTIKAATTTASIVIAERLWKRSKVGAIATMAAVNGISAMVAAHNASVLNQRR